MALYVMIEYRCLNIDVCSSSGGGFQRGEGTSPPRGGERFRGFFVPLPNAFLKNVFWYVKLKNFRLQYVFITHFRHI